MIEYLICSENPSEHWCHLNIKDQNVLDLGCGRWSFSDAQDSTPYYFLNNGASKVVGVDVLKDEIDFYNKINNNNKLSFVQAKLGEFDTLVVARRLINDNQITSIKCDIEGAELFFLALNKEDYKTINSIAIEYHGLWIKDLLLSHFNNNGFTLSVHGILNPEFGVIFLNKD